MGGGGAAIAITNKAVIVAFYEKTLMTSAKLNQCGPDTELAVLSIANHMKKNGF